MRGGKCGWMKEERGRGVVGCVGSGGEMKKVMEMEGRLGKTE